MAHPVGTGPYVLKQWRRSSLIVLERNPGYRERVYDAEPNADDAEGQALLARFKGRRMPMVDRVELSVIEQSQPRWLAFLNGQIDLIDPVPPDLAKAAVPNAQARAQPRQAGHPRPHHRQLRRRLHLLQHGRPAGRRPGAREGGAAPRDQPGLRRGSRDPPGAQRPGDSGAGPGRAQHLRLRPEAQDRQQRVQPGACQCAARPLRLQRPRRRRLARNPRRFAAGARDLHAGRRAAAPARRPEAQEPEPDRHPLEDAHPAVRREPEGRARRQADGVVAGQLGGVARRLRRPRAALRPAVGRRRTSRASSCRRSTRSTSA